MKTATIFLVSILTFSLMGAAFAQVPTSPLPPAVNPPVNMPPPPLVIVKPVTPVAAAPVDYTKQNQEPSEGEAKRAEQTQTLLDAQAKRAQQSQALLDDQAKRSKRADTILTAEEALIERREKVLEMEEANAKRFAKILDSWDGQKSFGKR